MPGNGMAPDFKYFRSFRLSRTVAKLTVFMRIPPTQYDDGCARVSVVVR